MTSGPAKFSRRALLATLPVAALPATVLLTACGRKRGGRFQGWLFAASAPGKAIAVANLAQFRPVTTIPLPVAPDLLVRAGERVYASSREGARLLEISPERFAVSGTIGLPGKPVWFDVLPEGNVALVVTTEPAAVLRVDLATRRVVARLPLPAAPAGVALSPAMLAIGLPTAKSIARVTVPELKLAGATDTGVACDTLRFRPDGKTILAGAPEDRQVVTVDAATGGFMARLPVPVAPAHFCFNNDGGQMFVSGAGQDSVAIVSPYQNEVGETMLAGRTPGAMAVSPAANNLFVANPESGDVTILDIDTRHLLASVHVGGSPGEIVLTPEGEYGLVLDSQSGNVSVLHLPTVLDRKVKTKPLFTVFPMLAGARSATIMPFGPGNRS